MVMKRILFLILFLCTAWLSASPFPHLIVEHYTADQGLPNNIVNCTLKDKEGFIWFGTWYGLCSFDGVKFRTYNNRDGFYSDIPPRKIQCIVEDKNGFLWIKTIDRKLYLFDKKQERFRAVYDDVKQYSENIQIIKVQNTSDGDVLLLTKDKSLLRACTDPQGKISISQLHDSRPNVNAFDLKLKHNVFCETGEYINWIGMNYQIASYRKGAELKSKPTDFIQKKIAALADDIFTCAYAGEKLLWLGDKNGQVYCIDPQTGTVNRYVIPQIKSAIGNLLVNESGILYISTPEGVYEYNLGYKQLTRLPISLAGKAVSTSFIDKYDKIWFCGNNQLLIYYDPLNKTAKQFDFPAGTSIGNFEVQDAGEQGMFFLTPCGEILLFDREQQTMIRLNQQKPFADDQPNQLFFHLLYDADGILWLSSTAKGIYRINFPKKQFQLLSDFAGADVETNESRGIRALYQARNGDIWIGTRRQILYRLDRNGQVKQTFSEKNYPVGNVYHIMEDEKGNLWFSTKGKGLVRAEPDMNSPQGLRFTRYTNDARNPNSISSNDAYFTFQDSKGRIWVSLLGGGLNLISEENGEVSFKHKFNGMKHYPPYGLYMEVRTMTEDTDGRLWVGTMDGLMSFDGHFTSPEQIEFETYREESASSNVADNDIYVLYKDADAQIWVSVFGGGLNKLLRYDKDARKPIFKSYGIREGLNNDVVMSIVEDDADHLWFATEGGLSCFHKQTEQFRNYDKYDGFLNVEMEEGSALHTLNGELWLGCKQGVLRFEPEKLETTNWNYSTYIVDFRVSNRDLRSFKDDPILMESVKYAHKIELNYHQSMFTIEFAALNYYNQNRVSYKYILNGYEKEWHYSGKNRIASYTNVPPGRYTFEVESIDEANPQLVSRRTLDIVVLPPWWLSWWAYAIYVILGAVVLVFALRLAFFMIKMKNDVYIEQRVSEMKIKFFTNISHELRTPLSLIKGPIQELKERESLSTKGYQYLELMEKNTNQMLQLVNQILDFRKIQNGKMRLHVSLMNLNETVETFQKEFRVLSEENEISYSFQLTDEPVMVWADREKLGIVIRNIISNAFKFTPAGGSIFVTMGTTEDGLRGYVRVEDSGVGIPHNKLTEIFERFSQGENGQNPYYQGTGIGLALSKEIVTMHHGSIKAENQGDQGAVFTVELLLGKEHYKPGEVDFYVSDSESATDSLSAERAEAAARAEAAQTAELTETDSEASTDEQERDASLPTLLLVEDNKDLCHLIRLQLDDKFNIHIANNGVEGLKKVHLYHPDIVVTDQMMPEMDGLEMLQRIRKDFQISHIPVIILTAKNDDEAKTRATSLGANAYITKPFSKDYLLARVEQLLGERKLFRERVKQQSENEDSSSYEHYLVKKDVQLLEKIHQVIEENMDNSDFNIDTIASGIGLSRSAFFKKLKSLTGLAPVDLVKEIRLNKSIEMIKHTDLSISEIAFAVGFKDSGYYSKCFRKKYDQTPREYMNEWRKG